jgi:hypothetical protein
MPDNTPQQALECIDVAPAIVETTALFCSERRSLQDPIYHPLLVNSADRVETIVLQRR